ncbi:hypothetical protein GCM10007874_10850 [Labrys miyagiensis]|uniref:ATP-cone domain-containing protein n=1 Tax=Labrys miyagiensis TaxID=346912 RepID=A0ABQ6CD01_9HYPH|nr:hypothetical protein GCM10007874_10850 [Labrys miyagiensis]
MNTAVDADLQMKTRDGSLVPLDLIRLQALVLKACAELADRKAKAMVSETQRNLYDGISQEELALAPILAACTLIETEPYYAKVSARLLNDKLRREALTFIADGPSRPCRPKWWSTPRTISTTTFRSALPTNFSTPNSAALTCLAYTLN